MRTIKLPQVEQSAGLGKTAKKSIMGAGEAKRDKAALLGLGKLSMLKGKQFQQARNSKDKSISFPDDYKDAFEIVFSGKKFPLTFDKAWETFGMNPTLLADSLKRQGFKVKGDSLKVINTKDKGELGEVLYDALKQPPNGTYFLADKAIVKVLKSGGDRPLQVDFKTFKSLMDQKDKIYLCQGYQAEQAHIIKRDGLTKLKGGPDDARSFMYGNVILDVPKPGKLIFILNH